MVLRKYTTKVTSHEGWRRKRIPASNIYDYRRAFSIPENSFVASARAECVIWLVLWTSELYCYVNSVSNFKINPAQVDQNVIAFVKTGEKLLVYHPSSAPTCEKLDQECFREKELKWFPSNPSQDAAEEKLKVKNLILQSENKKSRIIKFWPESMGSGAERRAVIEINILFVFE